MLTEAWWARAEGHDQLGAVLPPALARAYRVVSLGDRLGAGRDRDDLGDGLASREPFDGMLQIAELEYSFRWREAMGWWENTSNSDSGRAQWAMQCLAELLERQGLKEEALTWWERASNAGNGEAMQILAERLERASSVDEAEGWLRRAILAEGYNARWRLAILLRRTGRPEEADFVHRYGVDWAGRTERSS